MRTVPFEPRVTRGARPMDRVDRGIPGCRAVPGHTERRRVPVRASDLVGSVADLDRREEDA